MLILQGKCIVLGITGALPPIKNQNWSGVSNDKGDVRVVMSNAAKAFITALMLQAVSANSVSDSLLDPQNERAIGHIALAKGG